MNDLKLRKQVGQSVVLIALLMVGMIAFMGLVVDGGRAYGARRMSQNAADAGVFAGARLMTSDLESGQYGALQENAILQAVNCYAEKNGIKDTDGTGCNTTDGNVQAYYIDQNGNQLCQLVIICGGIPSQATGLLVRDETTINTFFLGTINEGLGAAGAHAKVQIGGLSQVGVSPMTLNLSGTYKVGGGPCSFITGTVCTLFGNVAGSGSFQWLNPDQAYNNSHTMVSGDCNSTGSLSNQLLYPTASIFVPGWVCTGPGVSANKSIRDALDTWLNIQPAYPNRIWLVPVYDGTWAPAGGLKAYHVSQVAAFIPLCYNFGGGNDNCASDAWSSQCTPDANGNKCMVGMFVSWTTLGGTTAGSCVPVSQGGTGVCSFELKE